MSKPQKKLGDWGFKSEKRVERNRFPIKSLCFYCGKTRWLNWLKSGKAVCDECKKTR
ncbi:MAG: hypothetical protein GF334_11555 [Candidatus Altiarchaeales archaeon]|nr:hypothetical protein [Candidatus Altiarchaeales archaeon]